MKYLSILMFTLFITACSSSDNSDGSADNESIVGTWSFTYPATQCVETYTFNASNSITITSLDEISTGTYFFDNTVNSSNRHSLSFTVINDNEQPDCEGNNINDVGRVVDVFAEFVTITEMNWYLQSSGGAPVVTVDKN